MGQSKTVHKYKFVSVERKLIFHVYVNDDSILSTVTQYISAKIIIWASGVLIHIWKYINYNHYSDQESTYAKQIW